MAASKRTIDPDKHRTLVISVVLFLICALAVMISHRDNVWFFHRELNLAIWIVGLPLGLAVVFVFLRRWQTVDAAPSGKPMSTFLRVVLIAFSALLFATLIRITADVVIDLTNSTPSIVRLDVDNPKSWTKNCSEQVRFRSNSGKQYRLCRRGRYSLRRVELEAPLLSGDQVAAHGRMSWAGFAVDKVTRVY